MVESPSDYWFDFDLSTRHQTHDVLQTTDS